MQRHAKLRRGADPLVELPANVAAAMFTRHVVLVGYGRVGQRIAAALAEHGIAHVVVEQESTNWRPA